MRRIAKKGATAFKGWAFPYVDKDGREPKPLVPPRQDPSSPRVFHTWAFHVAAAAFVSSAEGCPNLRLFDPTLMDEPCSPERWMVAMDADNGRFLVTDRSVFLILPRKSMCFLSAPPNDTLRSKLESMRDVREAFGPRVAADAGKPSFG